MSLLESEKLIQASDKKQRKLAQDKKAGTVDNLPAKG